MDNYSFTILYFVIEIFTIYCINDLYACLMPMKPVSPLRKVSIYLCVTLLYSVPNLIWGNVYVNMMFSVITFSVFITLFQASFWYKVVWVVAVYSLAMIAEYVTTIIAGILGNPQYATYLGYMAFSRLILFMAIKLFIIKRGRNKYLRSFSYYWWIVLIIPIASMYILHQTMVWGYIHLENTEGFSAIIIAAMLLGINILVFYLYEKLLEKYNETLVMDSMNIQVESYKVYLEKENANNERLKKWKHDSKNYLIGLYALLDDGQYQTVMGKIESEIGNFKEMEDHQYCADKVLNSIFDYKYGEALNKNIEVEYEFHLLQKIEMDYNDLAILLGNSMDNAITANIGLKSDKRKWIRVFINCERDMLFLKIQNPYEKIRKENNRYVSTKSNDVWEHGIGLKVIDAIVQKYNGKINIQDDNYIFSVEVIIYYL